MVSVVDDYVYLVADLTTTVKDEPLRNGIPAREKGLEERNPSILSKVPLRCRMRKSSPSERRSSPP